MQPVSRALLLSLLSSAAALGEVRELTDATFDVVVTGAQNVLVEFYAPDCGHCRTMEPEFYARGRRACLQACAAWSRRLPKDLFEILAKFGVFR